MLSSDQIRSEFLAFFKEKGHEIVESSSLVPANDPTLLFTNAGMNQFKDVFLGLEKRNYVRAATSQKCVRAGGKHNDLENVGYTARHHTFFEMLGNFSFGDYFKKEAIHYAWELLTEVYKIPKEKLLVTVYADDDEAYSIWEKDIGLPQTKIIRIGDNKGKKYASDNFWMMGDTGPCGPCSEIFYDHGKDIPGGPPGSKNEDGDRFIEIWNLVFMQFNQDENGVMHSLPKPSVDTGMGLERISAVLQDVHSNYEIDLFQKLIKEAAKLCQVDDLSNPSLKVLSDHIRAVTFLINDGVLPSNEGRGYVLRRIIRRAIRHGYKLGLRNPFFNKLARVLHDLMGNTYPIKDKKLQSIADEINNEESRFFETIDNGMNILNDAISKTIKEKSKILSGAVAFKLHDTYGFPLDLTADICREKKLLVNEDEFQREMDIQKNRAREAGKFKSKQIYDYDGPETQFVGYEKLHENSKIMGLLNDHGSIPQLKEHDEAIIILDKTPFYAESGGQVGDTGFITSDNFKFQVNDTYKIKPNVFAHDGIVLKGKINVGDDAEAKIDISRRESIMRNHSSTHLLHKALRLTLGDHVEQKGSLVTEDRTRFDFSHSKPLSVEEKKQIESIVNDEILKNQTTQTRIMSIKDAQKEGAMMLFDEKYESNVRVLDIGNSRELCGGTHVNHTGDIGLFKIQSETGIASGIRRIEATSGLNVLNMLDGQNNLIGNLSKELNTHPDELTSKVNQLINQLKNNEKELATLRSKIASNQSDELTSNAIEIKNFSYLGTRVDNKNANELREMIDKIKTKLKSAVIILASEESDKVSFAIGVTDNLTQTIKAGEIAKFIGEIVGGKGGGRDNMAMAGGPNIKEIDQALKAAQNLLSK
ncbi:MAG: alanine--tRNA ligase [Methylophilaceae bacterium]